MRRKIPTVLLIALLVGIVWLLKTIAQSETYGISEEVYAQHGEPDASTLVKNKAKAAARKPNIIVILADDLGYGDIGANGGTVIKTPRMDSLARQGMRFSQAYSSAPICSPSRAGLLTGRYPARSGIIQAMEAAGDSLERRLSRKAGMAMSNLGSIDMRGGANMVKGLPLSEVTIAEALKVAGYKNAAFGKWHLGDFTEWPEFHPYRHGFDHFVGFNMSNDDWPVAFYEGEEKRIEDIGLNQQRYTKLFTDEAIDFIEENKEQPFFVYLSHKDPHQPFFPSEQFAGKSKGGPYGDAVSEFDYNVGRVIDAVKRLGLDDNTLVLVTSDNGPWYEGSAGRLRGRKGQSYEGGFRVPLLAWWPGQVKAGATEDTPVMNIDFLPTFLNLAGLTNPSDRTIDGKNITPLLRGQAHDLAKRPLYFFHDFDVEGVRKGPWKYLNSISHYVWPNPIDKQDSIAGKMVSSRDYSPENSDVKIPTLGYWPLLYDLRVDAGESYNVAKHEPEVVDNLEENLRQWRNKFHADPRAINK